MKFEDHVQYFKSVFRPLYYELLYWQIRLRALRYQNFSFKQSPMSPKEIPIVINNRNRLTSLQFLIASLETRGYFNIYIIDNASTYPPLLEYYTQCKYHIFYLKANVGHLAIWKTGIYKRFIRDFYVYTDSDVVPLDECPDDFMEVFLAALLKNKKIQKVGFSLKIDDLPDHFKDKANVIEWEQKFYTKKVSKHFYEANIDTTFALYRPGMKGGASFLKMYRSAYPYQARHLPWYNNSTKLSEEELYYIRTAKTVTHWTIKSLKAD